MAFSTPLCSTDAFHREIEPHSENIDSELNLVLGHVAAVFHGERHPAEVESYRERNFLAVDLSVGYIDVSCGAGGCAREHGSVGFEGEIHRNIPIRGVHRSGPLAVHVGGEAG